MGQIPTCPKCGSSQITANKKGFSGKKAVAGAILTGGIGILAGTLGSNKIIVTCLACGHQFRPGGGRIKNEIRYEREFEEETKPIYHSPRQIYSQPISIIEPSEQEIKKRRMVFWIIVLMLFILYVIIGIMSGKNGRNDYSEETINDIPALTHENLIQLTRDDSEKVKKELDNILKSINAINVEPNKAMKKFSVYAAGLTNYTSNVSQVFQAAKITKQEMEDAEQEISKINLPEKLSYSEKGSLSEALSTISSSYLTMSGAFDEAMEMAKNPSDESYVEAFRDDMNQATEIYGQGLATVLRIQSIYKKVQKNISKSKPKVKPASNSTK